MYILTNTRLDRRAAWPGGVAGKGASRNDAHPPRQRKVAVIASAALIRHSVTMNVLILAASGASVSHTDSPSHASVRFLTADSLDLWPCFSPDGNHILFSRRVEQTWQLLLIPTESGQPQPLARAPLPIAATRANWSKQNNVIAFTGTSAHGQNSIWLINSDGSNPRELKLLVSSDQMFYPSWFPSGEQLAAMDAQDMVIIRVNVNTGGAVTVTDQKQVFTGMPSVSPDGKWIAFAGQKNTGQKYDQTKNSIWLVDDSGIARTVESTPGQGRAPTWSPDGKILAFESTRASLIGQYAIFLINRDGTGLIQVTDPALNADHPVWSPDGRRLAFSARASLWAKGRSIAVIDIPNQSK